MMPRTTVMDYENDEEQQSRSPGTVPSPRKYSSFASACLSLHLVNRALFL